MSAMESRLIIFSCTGFGPWIFVLTVVMFDLVLLLFLLSFLSFSAALLGLPNDGSTGRMSVSMSGDTDEFVEWNNIIVSVDCPNVKSVVGMPVLFSVLIHVCRTSW